MLFCSQSFHGPQENRHCVQQCQRSLPGPTEGPWEWVSWSLLSSPHQKLGLALVWFSTAQTDLELLILLPPKLETIYQKEKSRAWLVKSLSYKSKDLSWSPRIPKAHWPTRKPPCQIPGEWKTLKKLKWKVVEVVHTPEVVPTQRETETDSENWPWRKTLGMG